jgi:hypothetical protein
MADKYDGDTVEKKPLPAVSCSSISVIIVTGITPFGHMLLNTGGKEGWYFNVTRAWIKYPRFMGYRGYLRYMRENEKREIARIPVTIVEPDWAASELVRLMYQLWVYDPTKHNCVHFVDNILVAGKSKARVYGFPLHGSIMTWE